MTEEMVATEKAVEVREEVDVVAADKVTTITKTETRVGMLIEQVRVVRMAVLTLLTSNKTPRITMFKRNKAGKLCSTHQISPTSKRPLVFNKQPASNKITL